MGGALDMLSFQVKELIGLPLQWKAAMWAAIAVEKKLLLLSYRNQTDAINAQAFTAGFGDVVEVAKLIHVKSRPYPSIWPLLFRILIDTIGPSDSLALRGC